MKRLTTALVLSATTLVMSTPAVAQRQVSSECRSEVIKLCGRDRSKIESCLKENKSKLSEKCQKEVSAAAKAREEKKD